jgi:release factor glutamine methyltransferase
VTETRSVLVAEVAAHLCAAGFREPRRHARRLIAAALAISQADLFGHPDRAVDARQISLVRMMLGRVMQCEPLSRILGRREFWGLEIKLSAETLDPRPESETVVEAVMKRNPDRQAPLRILDLGTGTGCLLLALLTEFPRASGVGIDISEAAARTARYNALDLGFADRVLFLTGIWAGAVSGKFDAIVANPPYLASVDLRLLPPEVACHDPWRALDGGEDGLRSYSAIADDIPKLLSSTGIFVTEVGVGQADAVVRIMKANGLTIEAIEKDLAGFTRCVIAGAPCTMM